MSISALSSNLISDLSQQQNPFKEIKQDFQQLASALQSGDLTDAQSAYSNIQQVLQANSGSSTSGGSSTLQNDFTALGQALQSGDLSTAQSAFAQLQSDVQASRQTGGPGRWATQNQAQTQPNDQYVSSASQGQNPAVEAIQDYTQLASDLQSGNLTGAQSAYSNLQQLVQAASTSSTSSTTPTTVQTDFATLGQDLQAGNLTQSQSAFSQLQSDLDAATQPPPSTQATTPTAPTTTPTESPVQQVQQDYLQLASALQSGSLTGAQSAFTALEQALQTQSGTSTTATATSATSNDPIANDLSSLSQALTSGNLTQAQSAFSQLQTDIQAAQQSGASQAQNATQPQKFQTDESHRHHHHHGGDEGGSSGPSSSSTSSATNAYTSSTNNSSVNVYA